MMPWMVAERSSGGWTKGPSPVWDISAHRGVWGQKQGVVFIWCQTSWLPGCLGHWAREWAQCLLVPENTVQRLPQENERSWDLGRERFYLGLRRFWDSQEQCCTRDLKEAASKKDIFALVFVTKGRQRRPGEERNGSSILGQMPSRVQGTGWQRGGGGGRRCACHILGGTAAGIRARVLMTFVSRRFVLSWVPRAGG